MKRLHEEEARAQILRIVPLTNAAKVDRHALAYGLHALRHQPVAGEALMRTSFLRGGFALLGVVLLVGMFAASVGAQAAGATPELLPPPSVITAPPATVIMGSAGGASLELQAPGIGRPSASEDPSIADLNRRIRRARIGMWSSFGFGVASGAFTTFALWGAGTCETNCSWTATYIGLGLTAAGAAGMIISGAFLGRRKAQRRQRQRELQPQAQRKIQWDIATSRLLF